MENVTRLANREKNPVYGEFVSALEDAGYYVSDPRVYCPRYGIPQTRRRLVVLASWHGPIEMLPPTHPPDKFETVERALANLPPLTSGQADANDPLHVVRDLSDMNLRRARASKPGGTWKDWPEELLLDCHKRSSGKSFGSVYGRMKGDEPSPTITTQFHNIGTGRFVHPSQDRGISLREGAILQTFPRDYAFVEDASAISYSNLGRHIGNAVPVDLGRAIGRAIVSHLEQVEQRLFPIPT